jgi:hypothetical protein
MQVFMQTLPGVSHETGRSEARHVGSQVRDQVTKTSSDVKRGRANKKVN